MLTPPIQNSTKSLGLKVTVARQSFEKHQGGNKTFGDIEQNIKEKIPAYKTQQNLTRATGKQGRPNIRNGRIEKVRENSAVKEAIPMIKTKHEFPAAKYHNELITIQEKLDQVSSAKLIETYSIPARHRSMHSKLKSLKGRTRSLMAELNNRRKVYAVANRLISGDGLDSNLGRLDRDVMWFVAELKYRQIDSESSATLVG